MSELLPPAADLADLTLRIADQTWPTTGTEQEAMFERLHLRLAPEDQAMTSDDPRLVIQTVETSLPAVTCTSSTVDNEFLGLSLFAYTEHRDDGPQAKQASTELKRLLTATLGDPIEEWGPVNQPARRWLTGELDVETYCFQQRSSGIMIAISHTARSEAYDASRSV